MRKPRGLTLNLFTTSCEFWLRSNPIHNFQSCSCSRKMRPGAFLHH